VPDSSDRIETECGGVSIQEQAQTIGIGLFAQDDPPRIFLYSPRTIALRVRVRVSFHRLIATECGNTMAMFSREEDDA
jgi:hypothetical protein